MVRNLAVEPQPGRTNGRLERRTFRQSVACRVRSSFGTLSRAEEIADFTDGAPEGVDGPDGAGSQKCFQLCESHLGWIEVGAIGRNTRAKRPWRE